MSFRYASGINKPGFNPFATQTSTTYYNLYGWGSNNYGQLGVGDTSGRSSPTTVGSLDTWLTISAGQYISTAIKTAGTLFTWGRGTSGQLGSGATADRSTPVQVGALTNWSSVSPGRYNCVATKTDGTLWTWGNNYVGSLGLGNTTYYSSPKQVGSLTNWLKVAMSGYGTCFSIKTDGTLWSWGDNTYGSLGAGTSGGGTARSSPVQVGSLTTWSNVACGHHFVIATTTAGSLYAWGRNHYGQCGLNDTTNRSSPVQIGALTSWLTLSAGYQYVTSIKTDGSLWVWGVNDSGQLGLNNLTYYSSPKQLGSLTNWSKVAVGSTRQHNLSIKTDGTLWGWGLNNNNQAAAGATTPRSSPVQLGALTSWSSVAAGNYHSLGIE